MTIVRCTTFFDFSIKAHVPNDTVCRSSILKASKQQQQQPQRNREEFNFISAFCVNIWIWMIRYSEHFILFFAQITLAYRLQRFSFLKNFHSALFVTNFFFRRLYQNFAASFALNRTLFPHFSTFATSITFADDRSSFAESLGRCGARQSIINTN